MATIDSQREAAYRDRYAPITDIDRKRVINLLNDFCVDVRREDIPDDVQTLGALEKWQREKIKTALGLSA